MIAGLFGLFATVLSSSVSGDSFGSPNNIRFSYATSEEVINKTLAGLRDFFALIKEFS